MKQIVQTLALVAFFGLPQTTFSQHAVTTLAGSTTGYLDGIGTAAKFNSPTGLCISADGLSLYLADYLGHRIRKVNLSNNAVTTIAGDGAAGALDGTGLDAQFSTPTGLAQSSDGLYLYIADNGNSLIRRITVATNEVITIAGNGSFGFGNNSNGLLASFNQPTDIKVAPGDSVIYISDTENHVIRKMNLLTTSVTTFVGIAQTPDFVDANGTSAGFRFPAGLSISTDGLSLFLADGGNHRIRRINLVTKDVTTVAGSGAQGAADNATGSLATFNAPQGATIEPTDATILFVCDRQNNKIRKINLVTTEVTTVAGDGTAAFANNANGLLARFYQPIGCAVSLDGKKMYIADQSNYKIRQMLTGNTLGIEESNSEFNIYPNPSTTGIYTLESMQDFNVSDLTLTNSLGTVVNMNISSDNQNTIIDINGLPSGIYFLKHNNSENSKTSSLIKL